MLRVAAGLLMSVIAVLGVSCPTAAMPTSQAVAAQATQPHNCEAIRQAARAQAGFGYAFHVYKQPYRVGIVGAVSRDLRLAIRANRDTCPTRLHRAVYTAKQLRLAAKAILKNKYFTSGSIGALSNNRGL